MDFENNSVLTEEGVNEQELAELAENTTETGEEVVEVTEQPSENRKTEQDAAFAQMRRQNEELARQLADAQRQSKEYEDALGLFFDGEDKALQAQAHYNQRPIEEVRAEHEMESQLEELQNKNQSLEQQLLEQKAQALMNTDLLEIQKLHPEVKSIDELGKEYLAFRFSQMGEMGAEQAYQMAKVYKAQTTPKKPPVIGSVSTQEKPQSDYYTREEVAAMSAEEVSKNYDTIRKSMQKW